MDKPTVMVVDDEPHMLILTKMALEGKELEILTASSGEECINAIEAGIKPDLILLDVMMPGMSGLEVCKKIRESHANDIIKVALFSALPECELQTMANEIHADGYVEKGTVIDSLKPVVLKMIGKG